MPQTIKKLLFHIFFLSILSIEGFMLFQTLDRAHLDNELNSLNGPLVESWTFIHQTGPNENGYYNQDSILAFQIFGHHQTFGISENRAFYHDFKSYLESNPHPDIQLSYWPDGKLIEQKASLHLFSLSSGSQDFLSKTETQQKEHLGSLFFGGLFLISLLIYVWALLKLRKR